MKQKEQLAAQEQKLEELKLKSEDVETLLAVSYTHLLKPVYEGLRKIKFDKPRAAYKAEHEAELKQFYAARRNDLSILCCLIGILYSVNKKYVFTPKREQAFPLFF